MGALLKPFAGMPAAQPALQQLQQKPGLFQAAAKQIAPAQGPSTIQASPQKRQRTGSVSRASQGLGGGIIEQKTLLGE